MLNNLGYTNGKLNETLIANIWSVVLAQFGHREIWPDENVLEKMLGNELIEKFPEFVNGLEKYDFWNDYVNKSNFGTITKNVDINIDGALPQTVGLDDLNNPTMVGYDKSATSTNSTTSDLQEVIRNISNTYFWKLGLYDKLLKALEGYFVSVVFYEY